MADAKKTKLITELRALNDKDIAQKIADMRKELVEQHRAHAAGELPSPAAIRKIRKDIAKALTVQSEQAAKAAAQKEQEK